MRATTTTLLLIAALAGCGGGGLSRGEFTEKANANCKERQEAQVAAKGATWEVWGREAEKQRKLEPPDDLAGDWDRYLKLLASSTKTSRELSEPGSNGLDNDERSVLQGKATKEGVQARNIAEEMGLEVCAEGAY